MKAEIIATGTELLLGEIVDTNTPFIAGELARLGIDLFFVSTVGDNRERLLSVLNQAWQRSDILFMTGGLGPTQGDLTREMIASLLGEKLEVNAALKQELVDYFTRMGTEMPENNIKQATTIPSATPLHNGRGTAPGWWVERDGRIIVALPGPPSELQAMWQADVLPRLTLKAGGIIVSRTLKTFGLSESKIDEMLSPYLSRATPTLALYAKQDGIHLRITAKAADRDTANRLIAEREADIRKSLDRYIWGADADTLESVVGQLLLKKSLTLAVAESFTGGLLAYTLSSVPGSPAYFRGAVIVEGDGVSSLLGIEGEGSPPGNTAANMARWVRSRFGSDLGLGICSGDTDKSLNTGTAFIAIDGGPGRAMLTDSLRTRSQTLSRRGINMALFKLRGVLLNW